MDRYVKKISIVLCVLLLSSLISSGFQNTVSAQFDVQAESAILVEASTGKIIFEKDAKIALPPASMSKMMTEYLVLEAIEEGLIDWNTVTRASEYAHYLGGLADTSRVWLGHREARTVEELFKAMAIYSANDATVALAELVSGSEKAFVDKMNEKAEQLGMMDTLFLNSTGLPNSMLGQYRSHGEENAENLMSAYDAAIIARALVNDYPDVLNFSSIPYESPDYSTVDLINFNWMLENHPQVDALPYAYAGLDGLKTGYTGLAGYTFTGTATRDDLRLISVVMRTDSYTSRFVETARLLDHGFDHYQFHQLADEGMVLPEYESIEVSRGLEMEVPIAIQEAVTAYIRDDEVDLYSFEFIPDPELLDEDGALLAPVEMGDVIGEARIVYTGQHSYGWLDAEQAVETVPVVALESVEEAGWFRLFMRSTGQFFGGMWNKITEGIKGWFS